MAMVLRTFEKELSDYLASKIPLSNCMEVSVMSADHSGVVLAVPLAPNVNHRGTMFGGSASALAMLAGWGYIWTLLREVDMEGTIVIRRNRMDFNSPLKEDIRAKTSTIDDKSIASLLQGLRTHGEARQLVEVTLFNEQHAAAFFEGEFAVRIG
jgi:thioesterase domain-containing protein